MNILAIGAHPDDIELFCFGTLLKYKKLNNKIFLVLTTSGNQGSNKIRSREEIAKIREIEQIESAKLLDAGVKFLRFDDQLLFDSEEAREATLDAIRWAEPDVIFTHFPNDPSTDHSITGKLVCNVILTLSSINIPSSEIPISKKPSIFFWETVGGINFNPEVYVDITEVMNKKIEALSKHKSQISWMSEFQNYGFIESCETISKFRGLQSNYKYAEGFRTFKLHSFMPNFKLLP
ncbi:MAG: PIG-L family deacetylase [Cyanobacteria bacterium]|nr:PIG-L family deacetylase [Cyanobacteriota bacterium]